MKIIFTCTSVLGTSSILNYRNVSIFKKQKKCVVTILWREPLLITNLSRKIGMREYHRFVETKSTCHYDLGYLGNLGKSLGNVE